MKIDLNEIYLYMIKVLIAYIIKELKIFFAYKLGYNTNLSNIFSIILVILAIHIFQFINNKLK